MNLIEFFVVSGMALAVVIIHNILGIDSCDTTLSLCFFIIFYIGKCYEKLDKNGKAEK